MQLLITLQKKTTFFSFSLPLINEYIKLNKYTCVLTKTYKSLFFFILNFYILLFLLFHYYYSYTRLSFNIRAWDITECVFKFKLKLI